MFLVRIEQEYSSVVHVRNTIVLKAACFLEKLDEFNKKCSGEVHKDLIEKAGDKFQKSCKELPEWVCTVCHRMMFEKSGRTFNMNSYINLQGQIRNVLDWRYRFRDEKLIAKEMLENLFVKLVTMT